MKSLHFGAGKIGRGFIGAQLSLAGCDVTFVDVNSDVVNAINRQRGYALHILDREPFVQSISGVSAALVADSIELFLQADIVTTAVSVNLLPTVAPVVAEGLAARRAAGVNTPLNIICCENGIRATSYFKSLVVALLDADMQCWVEQVVGFADCCVDRIVPIVTLDNPLDVAVERYCEWCVDSTAIKGSLPAVSGMHLVDDIEARIYRKLFTLNTAHCAIAYLGALKGYEFIHEAVADTTIRATIEGIMGECSDMIVRKYGIDRAEQSAYCRTILERFSNSLLGDTIKRVSRDPMRKLSPQLYFSCPITLALQLGTATRNLSVAVAAALKFRSDEDMQSLQLEQMIARLGVADTVREVCGIDNPLVLAQIEEQYGAF